MKQSLLPTEETRLFLPRNKMRKQDESHTAALNLYVCEIHAGLIGLPSTPTSAKHASSIHPIQSDFVNLPYQHGTTIITLIPAPRKQRVWTSRAR